MRWADSDMVSGQVTHDSFIFVTGWTVTEVDSNSHSNGHSAEGGWGRG